MYEYVIGEKTKARAEKWDVLVYPAEGNSKYKVEVYNDDGLFLFFLGRKGKKYAREDFEAKYARDLKVIKSRRWWQRELRVW